MPHAVFTCGGTELVLGLLFALWQEKRRRTINNAKHQWEKTVNSRNSSYHSKRKTMPDLYATHVATVPNSDAAGTGAAAELAVDDAASSSSSRSLLIVSSDCLWPIVSSSFFFSLSLPLI